MKRCILLGILLLAPAAPCQAQISEAEAARFNSGPIRRRFIELVRLSRQPTEEQAKSIAAVHRMLPRLLSTPSPRSFPIPFFPPELPPDADKRTPEDLADKVLASYEGEYFLGVEAAGIAHRMLREHREAVAPLIRADLTRDERSIKRGLDVLKFIGNESPGISAFEKPGEDVKAWMRGFYDDVLAIFERDWPLVWDAARLMPLVGDPRAVDALVERDPARPTLFHLELSALSSLAPPHPKLVEALDSPDAKIRHQAVVALPSSDELLPRFTRLLKGSDANVRGVTARNIFRMSDAAVARARPELVALLNDPDKTVRKIVSSEFAKRKDAVAAPALLARAKEENQYPVRDSSGAVGDVKNLVGDAFNTWFLGDDPKSDAFKKAIADFEKWIAEHPAK